MAVVRWVFTDPVTSDTYEFEINPAEGGSPSYDRNISYQNTAAPDGKVLIFEGREQPQEITFSGTILSQEFYDALVEWYNKKHQITVTDDLGRTFSIIIKTFRPKRERAVHSPWKHSYELTAILVDWPPT